MYWLCLCIANLAVSSTYVNVALNKPAVSLLPLSFSGRFDANNAVDGRKSDLRAMGGQCSVTDIRSITMWSVNLTSIYRIHHITIYFVTSKPLDHLNWKSAILGFSLYVFNETEKSEETNSTDTLHLCFKDKNFTKETIPAVINITCPVSGQFVMYYNERRRGIAYPRDYSLYVSSMLCEVEVYGCPTTGYYNGSDCCPGENCQYCNIDTDTCEECNRGYMGHQCEQGCPNTGYYNGSDCCPGENCRYCNIDTDTCEECNRGYMGHQCELVSKASTITDYLSILSINIINVLILNTEGR